MSFFSTKDPNNAPTDTDFSPLPAGWYPATLVECEIRENSNGGRRISAQYEVTGAEYAGRKLWANYNLENRNPKAVEIAKKDITALCVAAGVDLEAGSLEELTDALNAELVGKVVELKVKIRKSEEYGDSNDVKGYRADTAASFNHGANAAPEKPAASKGRWA